MVKCPFRDLRLHQQLVQSAMSFIGCDPEILTLTRPYSLHSPSFPISVLERRSKTIPPPPPPPPPSPSLLIRMRYSCQCPVPTPKCLVERLWIFLEGKSETVPFLFARWPDIVNGEREDKKVVDVKKENWTYWRSWKVSSKGKKKKKKQKEVI